MRLDYVTIFPAYLAPLSLSLTGRAQREGLLEVHVHDLRRWARDRHASVDDTPYGGGAGMVMRPDPWGEALDELLVDRGAGPPLLVVPTPSGVRFTQRLAEQLATRAHLVFGCGRYEGIDQRVLDHARDQGDVLEVSVGDYVLGGGEAAALVVTEAVTRLVPGFVGNAESLVEESHAGGLLEYPVYTRPPLWRGRPVPPVLLSGDHAAIAAWRHEQAVRRTAERRPDLLHPSRAVGDWQVEPAVPADAGEILTLQRACWMQEALANDALADIPALHESLADVEAWLTEWHVYVVRAAGRLVGAVRARPEGEAWDIGRIMVAPALQGRGIGRLLL